MSKLPEVWADGDASLPEPVRKAASKVRAVLDSGTLQQIIEHCKVPSLSYNVMHEGHVIAGGGMGFGRNGRIEEAPNERTLFTLCSLSKAFVVALVGILVDKGKLDWDDPVSKYVPEYAPRDDQTGKVSNATIVEVLRHSSGLSNPTVSFIGPAGKSLVPKQDFIHVLNDTSTMQNGQSLYNHWCYSNLAYALAVLVIEAASETPFDQLLQESIFEPLQMHDTAVTEHQVSHSDNIAQSYVQLNDGEWRRIDHDWTSEKNTPMLGMIGIRSSAKDIMTFICALMQALNETTSTERKEELGIKEDAPNFFDSLQGVRNPLKQVEVFLLERYWWMPCSDGYEHNYFHTLPWIKAEIPCTNLSWGSWNLTLSEWCSEEERPTRDRSLLGQNLRRSGSKPMTAYTFGGTGFCGNGTAKFVPQTRTGVVVFSGGLNVGDASEFASLALLQAVLDLTPNVDIVERLVKPEVKARELQSQNLWEDIKNHKDENPLSFDPSEYIGVYSGLGIQLHIQPAETTGGLTVRFNKNETLQFPLRIYRKDTFSYWPDNRNEWLAGGWLDWDHWDIGLLSFVRNEQGSIAGLTWVWEKDWEPPFYRKSGIDSRDSTSIGTDVDDSKDSPPAINRLGPEHSTQRATNGHKSFIIKEDREDSASDSSYVKVDHPVAGADKEKGGSRKEAENGIAPQERTLSFRLRNHICRPL